MSREQTPTGLRFESKTNGRNNAYRMGNFVMHLSDVEWQEQANCKDADPDLFFPRKGQSTKKAKEICTNCEVQEECLDFSIDVIEGTAQEFGIWGGAPEVERRRLKQDRYRELNEKAS